MMTEVRIETDYIKLDALLKFAGAVMSGGEAKSVVAEGLVRLNGEECLMRGKKIYPGDVVELGGEAYQVTK